MSELEMTVEALKLCIRPEVLEEALARVKSATAASAATFCDADELEQRIEQLLLNTGMPTHIKGFRYTVTGIRLILEDPEMADGITKWLYPTIARIYNSTPCRVDRGIRHGIEVAWGRGDLNQLYAYFRNTVDCRRGKPTNSEFLTRMAYLARDQRNA